MLEMAHSHNEFLEMWSRRGALGVLMLLGIYAVPAFIFYPTRQRLAKVALQDRPHYLALRIVGLRKINPAARIGRHRQADCRKRELPRHRFGEAARCGLHQAALQCLR